MSDPVLTVTAEGTPSWACAVPFLAGLRSSRSCSSAEPGELAVDVGEAERGGFLRVLFGRVLDWGVALVRHADRVHLVRGEREGLLPHDLVLPASPEAVLVPTLDPGPTSATAPVRLPV